jgi:hypothetical protein
MSEKKNNDDIEIDDLEKTELVLEMPVKKPVVEETVDIIDIDKEIENLQKELKDLQNVVEKKEAEVIAYKYYTYCDRRTVRAKRDSNEYIDIVYCVDMHNEKNESFPKMIDILFDLAYKYRNVVEKAYVIRDELERCERYFAEPNMIIFDDPVRMIAYQYLDYEKYFGINKKTHLIDLFYIFDTKKGEVIRVKLRGEGEEDIKMEEICYQDRRTENLIARIIDFMHNYTYLPCLKTSDCV